MPMKNNTLIKITFLTGLLLFISSCHTPSYTSSYDSSNYGVDFREGKWLMNIIEAPTGDSKDRARKIATKTFKKHLGDQFYDLENNRNLPISYIPLNPDSMSLKRLKKDSGFDYFINIKSNIIKDDLGSMQIGKVRGKKQNIAETVLEIYDLNTSEIIYKQTVIGKLSVKDDSQDFAMAVGANNITVGALKRIMKKIDKSQK